MLRLQAILFAWIMVSPSIAISDSHEFSPEISTALSIWERDTLLAYAASTCRFVRGHQIEEYVEWTERNLDFVKIAEKVLASSGSEVLDRQEALEDFVSRQASTFSSGIEACQRLGDALDRGDHDMWNIIPSRDLIALRDFVARTSDPATQTEGAAPTEPEGQGLRREKN